ncbi:type II secretion system F family protein [Halorhodospira halochloris]|uniref:type II secretion system F family protein n=1 Tax=Halorhodospira halochloris TaxID=1052 RepID=UPI001EE8B62D|nr:type II secretion system F family protein [Halorhodospira halochloris]MCG5531253.1 type II secretion system F family protein [Halorhodospira halochloris]
MAEFIYQGRSRDGKSIRGSVEAPSLDAAINEIVALDITPIDIKEKPPESVAHTDLNALLRSWTEKSVSLEDLVTFVRQLHALIHAGVPIIRALRGLADNSSNPKLKRTLREVASGLESGQSLTEAMREHPKVFPTLLLAMIRVGEDSGRLEESLQRMAASLDQERTTRDRVKQALRYPSFVLVAILAALVIINLFVIPAFSDIFAQMDADLPFTTVILINSSEFFTNYWLYIFAGLAGVFFGVRAYINTVNGRLLWDRLKLRIPVVGNILLRALLARFARTFSMALRSGVPILSAMSSVAESTDNAYISQGINGLRDGIERGEGLYAVSERSGLFTPLVLQMLAVGEETGQISDMMDQVAEFYEREVEVDLEKLSSSIEPIVISFIAVLILVLALGVFLPMWQLGTAAM